MEQVDQQRAVAQDASVDDQAMLAGLREQLEATRAEASTTMCQRNLANHRATAAELERDRTHAVSAM